MSHESISALLDGECSPEELDRLLDEMERSPEIKQAFSRQVMAREAREGTRISTRQPCICADVMARLDEAPGDTHPGVVELARPRRGVIAQWRPLAGLAAAAAFGAIAVLVTLPQIQDRAAVSSAGIAPTATSGQVIPVSQRYAAPRQHAAGVQTVAAQPEDLQEYLVDHSYLSASGAMAYNADYRPDDAGSGDRR